MRNHGQIAPELMKLRNTTTLSKPARRRLQWMDFYESHNHNARLTCRHFGISPDVFYRWKRRYQPGQLASLEDATTNRKPKQVRTPTTDSVTVARIKALREQYPRWGKKKLHAMLHDEGCTVSEPTVGRTLKRLRERHQLNEPPVVTARLAGKKRRSISRRPYAKRRDWQFVPKLPGDLAQVDTLHITQLEGGKRYQFTATDYVAKFAARTVASKVTSTSASTILDAMEQRWPVRPKAIQVDGGSEFMAVFEAACQERGIALYVLPPHSPKLNGVVERMNRTSREEVYDLGLHDLLSISEHNKLLEEQDSIYNNVRPHESLGLKAPNKYYESIKH